MAGQSLGLDVAAAVSKVKKDKKPAAKKSAARKAAKAPSRARNTAAAFVSNAAANTGKYVAAQQPAKAAVAKERVVPLGQKQRYVHDYAKKDRKAHTFEQLKQALNITFDDPLIALLQKHALLTVDATARTVQYKPKYALATKPELHNIIRRHPLGISCADLKDAYGEAADHLNELAEDDAIFICEASERGDAIAFPNDLRLPGGVPDESVRDLVYGVTLPQSEADIDQQLKAAGIRKAKRSTARLKMAVIQDNRKAGAKKKTRKIRKLTNTHVAHLLEGNDDANLS